MKLRAFVLLTLAALSLAHAPRAAGQDGAAQQPGAYGTDTEAWARYTYPGDEFSVELPGMPYVMHLDRAVGRFPMKRERMRVFGRYSGGVVYFVAAYDRPQSSETLDMFATYLRGAWGVAPKGALTLNGFEGRAYEVSGNSRGRVPQELHGEGRVFVTKKHAYFALALSPEAGRPGVARFLDSLTLGPGPAGERVAESPPVPRFVPPSAKEAAPEGSGGPGRGGDDKLPLIFPPGGAPTSPSVGEPARDPNARKAIIIYKPEPMYTEEGRRGRVSGVVRLRLVLDSTGVVKDISVLKWLPNGLTESAISAARYMLFIPATRDGLPVSQYVTVEHNFNIY
jgi:TonB family protein